MIRPRCEIELMFACLVPWYAGFGSSTPGARWNIAMKGFADAGCTGLNVALQPQAVSLRNSSIDHTERRIACVLRRDRKLAAERQALYIVLRRDRLLRRDKFCTHSSPSSDSSRALWVVSIACCISLQVVGRARESDDSVDPVS